MLKLMYWSKQKDRPDIFFRNKIATSETQFIKNLQMKIISKTIS